MKMVVPNKNKPAKKNASRTERYDTPPARNSPVPHSASALMNIAASPSTHSEPQGMGLLGRAKSGGGGVYGFSCMQANHHLSGNTTNAANWGSVTGGFTSGRPTGGGPATACMGTRTGRPS